MIFEVNEIFTLLELTVVVYRLAVFLSRRHRLESGSADLKDVLLLVVYLDDEVVIFLDELIKRFLVIEAKVCH